MFIAWVDREGLLHSIARLVTPKLLCAVFKKLTGFGDSSRMKKPLMLIQ
jgi:hypothetical protein